MKVYAENDANPVKVCTKCGSSLPATLQFFSKGKPSNLFGLRAMCKSCCSKNYKEYISDAQTHKNKMEYCKEYRKRNAENLSIYRKEYRARNAGRIKEYWAKNSEVFKVRKHRYYIKNKESLREKNKNWCAKNRELMRLYSHRYRSKKLNLTSSLTLEEWERCLKYFNNCCAYCGSPLIRTSTHQDHFIPVTSNGDYSSSNIVCTCVSCNTSKRDNDFISWYIRQTFYSEKRLLKIYEYLATRRTGDFNEENRAHNVGRK